MYQSRCTAKNSWWWAERLPETCRVVIPIKLEFSASVGFIDKESVTMQGHTVVKYTFFLAFIYVKIDCQDRHWNTDQKEDWTLDDRRRDGRTNSTWRSKEQGTHLTLKEHGSEVDTRVGTKVEEITGGCKSCVSNTFIICPLYRILQHRRWSRLDTLWHGRDQDAKIRKIRRKIWERKIWKHTEYVGG